MLLLTSSFCLARGAVPGGAAREAGELWGAFSPTAGWESALFCFHSALSTALGCGEAAGQGLRCCCALLGLSVS